MHQFKKLSKIGVSLGSFTTDFTQFSGTVVEIWFLSGWLETCYHLQAFQRFLETS